MEDILRREKASLGQDEVFLLTCKTTIRRQTSIFQKNQEGRYSL
jgi:hypothetical protein